MGCQRPLPEPIAFPDSRVWTFGMQVWGLVGLDRGLAGLVRLGFKSGDR